MALNAQSKREGSIELPIRSWVGKSEQLVRLISVGKAQIIVDKVKIKLKKGAIIRIYALMTT